MDFSGRKRSKVELNVAPLIDIVFLLLIFFMLASTFLKPEAIDLIIQGSSTDLIAVEGPLMVSVDADETIKLNGLYLTLNDLTGELRARTLDTPDRLITLQAEDAVPVLLLVKVMDKIYMAGLNNIALSSPRK